MSLGAGRVALLGASPLPASNTAKSLDFEATTPAYLTMSSTNFNAGGGLHNSKKLTLSFWYKLETDAGDGTDPVVFKTTDAGQMDSIHASVDKGAGAYQFAVYTDGVTNNKAQLYTTYTSGISNWHHFAGIVDTTQSTASKRASLYIDGVKQSSFSTENYPDQNSNIITVGQPVVIGASSDSGQTPTDGLIFDFAIFTGAISINQLYNRGTPPDISGLSGLYCHLNAPGGILTDDAILAANWTNNGTVATSTTLPS